MNTIAINNLRILKELPDDINSSNLIIDGKQITTSTEENYKSIFNLNELEYPIYFSFYQLFTSIRYSNLYKINEYKTNDILTLMDSAIDRLYDTIDSEKYQSMLNLIGEIDSQYIILKERNDTCSFWKVWETFNDHLDSFSETLQDCKKYLYISYPKPDNDVIEEVNKETGETNPNLIYDDETDIDDTDIDDKNKND